MRLRNPSAAERLSLSVSLCCVGAASFLLQATVEPSDSRACALLLLILCLKHGLAFFSHNLLISNRYYIKKTAPFLSHTARYGLSGVFHSDLLCTFALDAEILAKK